MSFFLVSSSSPLCFCDFGLSWLWVCLVFGLVWLWVGLVWFSLKLWVGLASSLALVGSSIIGLWVWLFFFSQVCNIIWLLGSIVEVVAITIEFIFMSLASRESIHLTFYTFLCRQ
eukprot:c29067_g2_i1 orf=87-431(+)